MNAKGVRHLAGAIVAQALRDLEDSQYRTDALNFLNSDYCKEILLVLGDNTSILWGEIESYIARVIDINKQELYRIQRYAFSHSLQETADYFDISIEDMQWYAEWKNITFRR